MKKSKYLAEHQFFQKSIFWQNLQKKRNFAKKKRNFAKNRNFNKK